VLAVATRLRQRAKHHLREREAEVRLLGEWPHPGILFAQLCVARRDHVDDLLERPIAPDTRRLAGRIHLDLERTRHDDVGLQRLEVGANGQLDEVLPMGRRVHLLAQAP